MPNALARIALAGASDFAPSSRAAQAAPTALGDGDRPRVRVIAGAPAILALEAEWRALEAGAPDTALFQSFAWCRNHLELMAANPGFRPVVVLIERGSAPIALLPLSVVAKHGLRLATGMCEPFQQYTEWLVAEGEDPAALAPMLRNAIGALGVDYLHLGQVREGGPLCKALARLHAAKADADAAPFVEIAAFADREAYLRTLNAKTRKNLRNSVNRLEREAPVTHCLLREGPQFEAAIGRAFDGRAAWLKRLGLTSRAFRDADFAAFVSRFAERRNGGVDTVALALFHGDVPVSDQWGFLYKGRYYAYMATWNPAYEAASPGRIHLGEVIATGFAQGWRVADFMIPAVPYKLTWASGSIPVGDFVLPLSARGRLHLELWLKRLRPVAKRVVAGISPALRSRLVKWFLPWFE